MKCFVLFFLSFFFSIYFSLSHFQFPSDKWMINGTQQKPQPFVKIDIVQKGKKHINILHITVKCICVLMWLNHIFFFCLLGFFVFVLCYSELCIIIIFIITIIAHKTFAVNVNRTTYICAHTNTNTHNSRSSYLNPPSTLSSTTKLIPPN